MKIPIDPIESRLELTNYIKRQLGAPIVDLEITEEQIDDVINEVAQIYGEYAREGQELVMLRCNLTNHSSPTQIKVPKEIYSVEEVYHDINLMMNNSLFSSTPGFTHFFSSGYSQNFMFNQIQFDLTTYRIIQEHLDMVRMFQNNKVNFSFNKNTQFLTLYLPVKRQSSIYVYIAGYTMLDPEIYYRLYNDRWFKRSCVSKCKILWGNNLIKFDTLEMDAGWKIVPSNIISEGEKEWEKLEIELEDKLTEPPMFTIG